MIILTVRMHGQQPQKMGIYHARARLSQCSIAIVYAQM